MVHVDDINFMYFGWWRQETTEGEFTGRFDYQMLSNTSNEATASDFATLAGSAIYEGPAIGQYAIPLAAQLNHGKFTATARFTADFDTDILSGSVTGFDVAPGWSLTLHETEMANGNVTMGDVSWTIDGNTRDGGEWDGDFHSEIRPYAGHFPDGLTGTFDAEHGPADNPVARLQGAFGTHKQP